MRAKLILLMQRMLGWRLWLTLTLTIILSAVLLNSLLDMLVFGAIQKYSLFSSVFVALLVTPPTLYFLHYILTELTKTRQRELELEAQYASSRLNIALEHSQIIIWEYDFLKDDFSYEDAKLRLLGIDLETLPHTLQSWIGHIHPDDQPIFLNRLQAITVAGAPAFDQEYRFQSRPEAWVWLHSQGKITQRDAHGNPLLAVGATSNITERKMAETRLLQSDVMLRSTLDSTDEGILMIAQDGRVLSTNKRFIELWHVPPHLAASGNDCLRTPKSRQW